MIGVSVAISFSHMESPHHVPFHHVFCLFVRQLDELTHLSLGNDVFEIEMHVLQSGLLIFTKFQCGFPLPMIQIVSCVHCSLFRPAGHKVHVFFKNLTPVLFIYFGYEFIGQQMDGRRRGTS